MSNRRLWSGLGQETVYKYTSIGGSRMALFRAHLDHDFEIESWNVDIFFDLVFSSRSVLDVAAKVLTISSMAYLNLFSHSNLYPGIFKSKQARRACLQRAALTTQNVLFSSIFRQRLSSSPSALEMGESEPQPLHIGGSDEPVQCQMGRARGSGESGK